MSHCSICLEPATENLYNHNPLHPFHRECLENWLKESDRCPVCREEIKEEAVKASLCWKMTCGILKWFFPPEARPPAPPPRLNFQRALSSYSEEERAALDREYTRLRRQLNQSRLGADFYDSPRMDRLPFGQTFAPVLWQGRWRPQEEVPQVPMLPQFLREDVPSFSEESRELFAGRLLFWQLR